MELKELKSLLFEMLLQGGCAVNKKKSFFLVITNKMPLTLPPYYPRPKEKEKFQFLVFPKDKG